MSIQYGIQSVVFYVLSCTTCAKINHRRKARKVAEKERKEKLALEMEQPGLYRHPSPFNTNPFWNEEISLGPGPPKRKGDKGASKNTSTRALNTAGAGSITTSDGGVSTDPGSSPTVVANDHRLSGDNWNRKRYQREDEELWGHESPKTGQRILDAFATAGSQVGSTLRAIEGRLSKSGPSREENTSPYYVARNPPVNDLHPPIVSTAPTHKGATRWMLQPPPPAKVMEGKQRANRSRSGSGTSTQKGGEEPSLSREVSRKLVEARLKKVDTMSDLELRNLTRPPSQSKSLRPETAQSSRVELERTQSAADSLGPDSSESDKRSKRKRASPVFSAVVTSRKLSIDSIDDVQLERDGPSTSSQKTREIARPAVQPISSLSILPSKNDTADSPNRPKSSKVPSASKLATTLLPINANAMPTALSVAESEFPGERTFRFPDKKSQKNLVVAVVVDQSVIA